MPESAVDDSTDEPNPCEAVLSTPELYALIAERIFDPELGVTTRRLDDPQTSAPGRRARRPERDRSPVFRYDVATLASLARVNRALSHMPWPSAAGAAHAAVLGHAAEAKRRRRMPSLEGSSPAAVAARAAGAAKLEAGLGVVARACAALDAELLDTASDAGAPAVALARAPGSAAERAYRACLLYTAVDALWRVGARNERDGYTLLPEPPPLLVRALCTHVTSARLPAELRAAALSTLAAASMRLARAVDPRCEWANMMGYPAYSRLRPALPAPQLERLARAGAELRDVCRALDAARASAASWLGPLALAIMELLDDHVSFGSVMLYYWPEQVSAGESKPMLRDYRDPMLLMSAVCPRLCELFADRDAPAGARVCAADALERFGDFLLERWYEDDTGSMIHERAGAFVMHFDESGAADSFAALVAEPTPARRHARLLEAAVRLELAVGEMRALVEEVRELDSDFDEGGLDDSDDDGSESDE